MVKTKTNSIETDEIYGQYASDWALNPDANFEDKTGTLAVRGDGNSGFHQGAILFDTVDRVPDEATGEIAREEDLEAHYQELALHIGELPVTKMVRLDAAEQWLRQNDPQYNGRQWQ
jgi:hypothetical protein